MMKYPKQYKMRSTLVQRLSSKKTKAVMSAAAISILATDRTWDSFGRSWQWEMPPCKNHQRTQDSQRAAQSILWQVRPMACLSIKAARTGLLPLPQIKMGTQKPWKSKLVRSISRNCLHQQASHWTKTCIH